MSGATNDDGASARNADPAKNTLQNSAICAAFDAARKEFATLRAEAARAGCTLHALADDGYLLCRWGMAKELPCLRSVGDVLRRIGGAR